MIGCGFLARVGDSDVYMLTEDGRGFLDEYERFKRFEDMLLQPDMRKNEDGDYTVPR
jgi:predicted transcriptional regulator